MRPVKKNTNRIAKVNALIQKIVGQDILHYLDGLAGIVTVSKAEVSRDLRWVKIWISIVAGDDKLVMERLNKNIYHIQGRLNDVLAMKITPRIQFFLDTSARYAQHINELIKELHNEDDAK